MAPPRPGPLRGVRSQLEAADYVEEEHFVQGVADLFTYDGQWNTVPLRQDVPFTTRLLVRRPTDGTGASGETIIEPLHPSGDMASAWPRTGRTIVREGLTWIGVTQEIQGLRALKHGDADRYGDLQIPEPGLGYDMVARIATWLRSDTSPVPGIQRLLMTGASYTGTFQRVFIGDGFHQRARRPDGGPAIDGYLIQISSGAFMLGGYTPLSKGTPVPPSGDRRRTIQGVDVPVIEILSEGEAETHACARRPDSDAPERYRLYEVPGAAHMVAREAGPMALPVQEPPSDFPMDMLVGGALQNLRRWIADDVPPPRCDRLVLLDDRDAGPCGLRDEAQPLQRDEHGNAVSGLRTPWVDVPVASYYPHSTPRGADRTTEVPGGRRLGPADVADLMGCMTRFAPEKLRELYGTPARYRELFESSLQQTLEEGWIAPTDADRARERAGEVRF
ncbi:MAG: alpha/beta hydrolase domain-containing protein [Myxococcales bacterium]|nr:alpha/beta hydrolase domain-containing protein [Myxococcales bacterium]